MAEGTVDLSRVNLVDLPRMIAAAEVQAKLEEERRRRRERRAQLREAMRVLATRKRESRAAHLHLVDIAGRAKAFVMGDLAGRNPARRANEQVNTGRELVQTLVRNVPEYREAREAANRARSRLEATARRVRELGGDAWDDRSVQVKLAEAYVTDWLATTKRAGGASESIARRARDDLAKIAQAYIEDPGVELIAIEKVLEPLRERLRRVEAMEEENRTLVTGVGPDVKLPARIVDVPASRPPTASAAPADDAAVERHLDSVIKEHTNPNTSRRRR